MTYLHHKKAYLALAATLLLMMAVFALKTSKAQLVLFPPPSATSTPPAATPESTPPLNLDQLRKVPSSWGSPARAPVRHKTLSGPTTFRILETGGARVLVAQENKTAKQGDSELVVFLSPGRKLLGVTAWPCCGGEGDPWSYIADLDGKRITSLNPGSFRSWTPDSKGILLYRSNIDNPRGREIYVLDVEDDYRNLNLPIGTINADVSSAGDIVYALTPNSTDHSNLWVRDKNGTDRLILRGENNIFSWPRWSPDGTKIAFLRSKMRAQSPEEARQLWIVNADGSGAAKIAEKVLWGYPPVWSPDGAKMLFTVQENEGERSIQVDEEALESNVWEYDAANRSSRKVTSFSGKRVLHPVYSPDGSGILFVSDQSGADEIWKLGEGGLQKLTNDAMPKRYPIAL